MDVIFYFFGVFCDKSFSFEIPSFVFAMFLLVNVFDCFGFLICEKKPKFSKSKQKFS